MSTSIGLITINAEKHDGEQVKYEVKVENLSPDQIADASIALMDRAIELGGSKVAIQAFQRSTEKKARNCDCPSCTERRKRNAKNPNVN